MTKCFYCDKRIIKHKGNWIHPDKKYIGFIGCVNSIEKAKPKRMR
jgi:hypothetical protein